MWENMVPGGRILFAHATTARDTGVAILLSNRIHIDILTKTKDPNGRYLILTANIDGYHAQLANIYAPTTVGERPAFYTQLDGVLNITHDTIL